MVLLSTSAHMCQEIEKQKREEAAAISEIALLTMLCNQERAAMLGWHMLFIKSGYSSFDCVQAISGTIFSKHDNDACS